MKVDLAGVIAVLLSTGAGAFILALVKGWRDIKAGARRGQREALAELVRYRNEAEADRDYWRDLAGRRAYQLRLVNVEPSDPDPVPPSERPRKHR